MLGELHGELYSFPQRDAAHLDDEFIRREGRELLDGRRAEAAERGAGGAMQRRRSAATGAEDEELELMELATNATTGESIVGLSWRPSKNLLAAAQLDGVVALYHVGRARAGVPQTGYH
ncbi:hypothetical protein PR002_g11687 [Phytophthora rubi]|uniref:Anaphase-promoting complex subunit 4 WD40 domain-containing protein n=1 Tax=Phytophthora rubi TaxID=129364 RepID=A0A6A3LZE7_9STRA|nr:hypothetical protein PR002_g11687 [Phytophthora rubi]